MCKFMDSINKTDLFSVVDGSLCGNFTIGSKRDIALEISNIIQFSPSDIFKIEEDKLVSVCCSCLTNKLISKEKSLIGLSILEKLRGPHAMHALGEAYHYGICVVD